MPRLLLFLFDCSTIYSHVLSLSASYVSATYCASNRFIPPIPRSLPLSIHQVYANLQINTSRMLFGNITGCH